MAGLRRNRGAPISREKVAQKEYVHPQAIQQPVYKCVFWLLMRPPHKPLLDEEFVSDYFLPVSRSRELFHTLTPPPQHLVEAFRVNSMHKN